LAQAVALCLVPLLAPLSVLTATAPTAIYSLSLHDALPISGRRVRREQLRRARRPLRRRVGARGVHKGVESREIAAQRNGPVPGTDRKSTRLNSSHVKISYAVFCLKKKKTTLAPPIHGLPRS